MTDRNNAGEALYSIAKAITRQLIKKYELRWDVGRIYNTVQEISRPRSDNRLFYSPILYPRPWLATASAALATSSGSPR